MKKGNKFFKTKEEVSKACLKLREQTEETIRILDKAKAFMWLKAKEMRMD